MKPAVAALALLLAPGRLAAGPLPSQIVVAVGNDVGLEGEEKLHHAESDARRVAQLFVELGTATRERTAVLLGAGRPAIERSLAEARGRAAELAARGQPVVLLVYYAGHGDKEALHLGATPLPIAALRAMIAEVPASVRVLVVDACRTTSGSRARGVVPGPEFSIETSGPALAGDVFVAAASEGEPAQESDDLGGAVFTHYLLTALRGAADLDGDGRVTLDEAYGYAAGRVLQRTTASASAVQRPAYEMSLAGFGPLVLTTPAGAGAHLVLPAGDARYFVFSQPSGVPLAEVMGRRDAAVTLALPPGRFLVHRRGRGGVAVAEAALPWGGTRSLEERDFVAVDGSTLAARGGPPKRLGLELGYRLEAMPGAAGRWAHGVGVGFELPGALAGVTVTVSGSRAAVDLARWGGDELRLGLGVSVRRLVATTAAASAWVQGEAFVRELWQRLEREPSELSHAGYDVEQRLSATDGGALVGARGALALSERVSLFVTIGAGATLQRQVSDGAGWHVAPLVVSSVGVRLDR